MITQGSDEWKQLRLGKLTASRMVDVLSEVKSGESASRKNYRAKLVAERLTGTIEDSFTNAAMLWGTENEIFARSLYESHHDVFVDQVDFIPHPSIKMCGASPDGLVSDDGLVEIKCPNTATHIDYLLDGVVPAKYKPQMALQLSCAERKWCDFVSYDPRMPENMRLFVVRFVPDHEYMEKIHAESVKFLTAVSETVALLIQNYC